MTKFWIEFDTDVWVSRTGMSLRVHKNANEIVLYSPTGAVIEAKTFKTLEEERAAALEFMAEFEEQES